MTVISQLFGGKCLFQSVLSLLILISTTSFGQPPALHPPLDGELLLSGTFGEVRGNHFHTGMDFKTGGKIGASVYAVEAGEVVRVKVEPGGYGKALYVKHPDGFTSVYAHLNEFAQPIAAWVKEQQYAKQEFKVDLYPKAGQFSFKRGEELAKSGNTGGSGGPHLHFELRSDHTGQPINPSRYGFDVKDERMPELSYLLLYEHFGSGAIGGSENDKKAVPIAIIDSTWKAAESVIEASGPISFGIGTLDRLSGAENPCGIYSVELHVDGKPFHSFRFDHLNFATKRLVNTHVDYRFKKEKKAVVHRTYRSPTNKLDIYDEGRKTKGILPVELGKTYDLSYTVTDHYGNKSILDFQVKGTKVEPKKVEKENVVATFYPEELNEYFEDGFKFSTPKAAVYDTLDFRVKKKPVKYGCVAPLYSICDLETPLNKYCSLSIKVPPADSILWDKLLVVSYSSRGLPIAEGGTVKDGWITTNTRSFGDYSVMMDKMPPEVKTQHVQGGLNHGDTLRFFVTDDLSGIADIHATMNDEWVLLEWDPKNDLAFWVVDERLVMGMNKFEMSIVDKVGNHTLQQKYMNRKPEENADPQNSDQ